MKISPRQLEKMARQMGMQMQPIEAEKVIIVGKEKKIIIDNPQVSKVNAMGQDTYQISGGEISEQTNAKFSPEDIKMIMDQTGVSEDEAEAALEETQDIAEAILKIKQK